MKIPEIGLKGRAETLVDQGNTAAARGSGSVAVFSTPSMIALMEQAAQESLLPYLEAGEASVGIRVDISHLAATPLGMRVYAESELVEADRRRLVFRVRAYDEKKLIGEGRHERFVIDVERFMAKNGEA